MHPKQETMCIADSLGNISLHTLDDLFSKPRIIHVFNKKLRHRFFCLYSCDGSYIVAGKESKLYIIDPDAKTNNHPRIKAKRDEMFKDIAFHPNGSVLAILCSKVMNPKSRNFCIINQFVRYLNIKTMQCVSESPLLKFNHSYNISFSDDGFEVVVALPDRCVRMHVPFAVKEKCIHSLCVLNQLKKLFNLPNDITRYCLNFLQETFKF
jgi:hypothetical protein